MEYFLPIVVTPGGVRSANVPNISRLAERGVADARRSPFSVRHEKGSNDCATARKRGRRPQALFYPAKQPLAMPSWRKAFLGVKC